jgi:hypothetical protein
MLELARNKTGYPVTIRTTTNFRLAFEPCGKCGKVQPILSGLPSILNVKIPLRERDVDAVAGVPVFIAGDFKVNCINGYAHIVVGLKNPRRFIVSLKPDYESDYYEEGSHFEEVLTRFILGFKARSAPGYLTQGALPELPEQTSL